MPNLRRRGQGRRILPPAPTLLRVLRDSCVSVIYQRGMTVRPPIAVGAAVLLLSTSFPFTSLAAPRSTCSFELRGDRAASCRRRAFHRGTCGCRTLGRVLCERVRAVRGT